MNPRDHTHHRNVLFVDDDHPIRFLAAKLLQRGGYDVDTAPDGYIALQKLQNKRYDLVILDLVMPRVNGYDVIAMLPTLPDRIPAVIVLTGLPREKIGNLDPALVHAVVEKPVDIEQFLQTIASALETAPRMRTSLPA